MLRNTPRGEFRFPNALDLVLRANFGWNLSLAGFIVNAFVPDRRGQAGTALCDETPFEIREKLDCSDSYINR